MKTEKEIREELDRLKAYYEKADASFIMTIREMVDAYVQKISSSKRVGVEMTVREIVERELRANGFDGLCNDDCGCGFDDFMPCDGNVQDCKAAYRWECGGCHKFNEACNCPSGCYQEAKQ